MHFGAMDPDCMQWRPCSDAQCIPIECSGVDAKRAKESQRKAVDCMEHGPKHPDGMQWIPCIVIECGVIYAAW